MTTTAVPAVIATAVAGPVGGVVTDVVSSIIHTSAAGPNQDAATAATPLAMAGNVVAWKAAYKRGTYIQTQTSAQPWKALWAAIVSKYPDAGNIAGDGPNKPPGVLEDWVAPAPEQVLPLVNQYTAQLGTAANVAYYTNSAGHVVTPTSSAPPANGGAASGGGVPLATAGFPLPTTPLGWLFALGLITALILAWHKNRHGGAS